LGDEKKRKVRNELVTEYSKPSKKTVQKVGVIKEKSKHLGGEYGIPTSGRQAFELKIMWSGNRTTDSYLQTGKKGGGGLRKPRELQKIETKGNGFYDQVWGEGKPK